MGPLKPLVRGGPEPGAQRHALPPCLVAEPVAVVVGDYEVDSCHRTYTLFIHMYMENIHSSTEAQPRSRRSAETTEPDIEDALDGRFPGLRYGGSGIRDGR